jgi:hypothetical protein
VLKSIISFSILFVALTLAAPVAQAQEACDFSATGTSAPNQTPWRYRKATGQEVREARKQDKELVDYLFGERAEAVLKMTRLDRQFAGPTSRFMVPELPKGVTDWTPMPRCYAPAQHLPKYILVSIKDQFIGAYEYGQLVFSHPIASGKLGKPTPTGDFKVMKKDPNHKSSLYQKPDGTPCPMPWGLQFRSDCWFHAGNLSGIKASHGCVRQRAHDAKRLYDWATVGIQAKIVRHL